MSLKLVAIVLCGVMGIAESYTCDEVAHGAAGSAYVGCQTTTKDGKTCQAWTSQSPHTHSYTPSAWPHFNLNDPANHNYCRNPNAEEVYIWCYTTDSSDRWGYCNPVGASSSSVCNRQTTETCYFGSCSSWRGETHCVNTGTLEYECHCKPGYCSYDGETCVAAPSAAVSSTTQARWQSGNFKVLAQNIWNSFSEGGQSAERIERLNAFMDFLEAEEYDVILAQEMFVFNDAGDSTVSDPSTVSEVTGLNIRSDLSNIWAAALHKIGFIHQTDARECGNTIGSTVGTVIYSKFQLSYVQCYIGDPPFEPKGWVHATLTLPDGNYMTVFSVHLDSGDAVQRKVQWTDLAAKAQAIHNSNPQNVVLVAGDFNICSGLYGNAVDQLQEFNEMQAALVAAGMGTDLVSAEGNGTIRYDYIENKAAPTVFQQVFDHAFITAYVNDNTTASVVDTRTPQRIISDHLGVGIHVTLAAGSTVGPELGEGTAAGVWSILHPLIYPSLLYLVSRSL